MKRQPGALSRDFKRVFALNLFDYWSVVTGFDLVAFDQRLETPAGYSCRDHVAALAGAEGVRVITDLVVL